MNFTTNESIFDAVLYDYYYIFWSPVFFCAFTYGVIYLGAGVVAAFAVTRDKYLVKLLVILFSSFWGVLCGLLTGIVIFSLIAGIYVSVPLYMRLWQAACFGVGLGLLMQLVAIVRRLYVYV